MFFEDYINKTIHQQNIFISPLGRREENVLSVLGFPYWRYQGLWSSGM
jgi:hypothetical protein